jgi:transcriptional antiterminator RfaH
MPPLPAYSSQYLRKWGGQSMKQWYALRSKPRRELLAADMLSRAGIEAYVPQVPVRQQHGRPASPVPFFPGYFFSKLDPDLGEIQMARYTVGVLDVVGYGGKAWSVPEELVEAIKDRLRGADAARALANFNHGERVVITSGPLKDAEAVFDRHLSAAGRVRVLVRMLQRMCPAEVNVGHLRRDTKAA